MYADFQLFTDLAGLAEALLPGAPLPRQLRSARTAAVLLLSLIHISRTPGIYGNPILAACRSLSGAGEATTAHATAPLPLPV